MPRRYKVSIAPEAKEAIADAFRWIAARNRDAAIVWRQDLRTKIGDLSELPESHSLAPEYRLGYTPDLTRQFLFGRNYWKYRVLFVIEGDEVIVVRVHHGARRYIGEDPGKDAED